MGLDMRTKKSITKELAKRYQKARKKEKTKILTEFINLTGYNLSYAGQSHVRGVKEKLREELIN